MSIWEELHNLLVVNQEKTPNSSQEDVNLGGGIIQQLLMSNDLNVARFLISVITWLFLNFVTWIYFSQSTFNTFGEADWLRLRKTCFTLA